MDMFHSRHPAGLLHATLRAVSGAAGALAPSSACCFCWRSLACARCAAVCSPPALPPRAAAFPCAAGGPVYTSDRPGHHDFALLRRLVLPDGSVLRCTLPGRPTPDCLFADVSRDGKTVLKVMPGLVAMRGRGVC